MIAEIARTLVEFLKLAPRYFFAVGLAAGFLLFAGPQTLKDLGVFEFAQRNRSTLGLVLVGSSTLFGAFLLADLLGFMGRWWNRRRYHGRITKRLHNLTEDEKQILRFYFAQNIRANVLRTSDGVVKGLEAAGVIHQSASLGDLMEGFAHHINDYAWDYLRKYPRLLEGTTDIIRTDKRQGHW